MTTKFKIVIACVVVAIIVAITCLFTISQGQAGLVLRLGKLKTVTGKNNQTEAKTYQPGLHFKLPLIDTLKKFDVRLQTLDIQSSRIVTKEKKDVIVDYYVKWRISNLSLYYKRTGGDAQKVGVLLDQQLNDALRAQFGRRTIQEVVSDDRAQIMTALNKRADDTAQSLGIDVIDVRIKRIDLPEEVSNAVYERMRAEREQSAKKHRSEGKAKAEAIRAQADAEATIIVAGAKAEANETRAIGDQLAAKIYADAYSKNVEFYAFLRSMNAYNASFSNKNDILVVTPDSAFFQYFNYPRGKVSVKTSKE